MRSNRSRAENRRRRWPQVVERATPALLLLLSPLLLACSAAPRPAPRLLADDSVGADLQAVADETWSRFLTLFEAKSDCFGDVRLHAAHDLPGRAAYDPGSARVSVRVPATRAMLQSALIHEWAHHVEFQCPAQAALRPDFLAAQGLPADTPWRIAYAAAGLPESEWADIPAEQYAEAVVELVLGRRQIPTTARVRPEAVEAIARWASGRESTIPISRRSP